MATQPNNPFVLPGFGQPGELGQNPLLASMEMMRQSWQNLAGLGGFDTSMMSAALSPEDLERRISDLRAVENWLRMNLSMLSSTIQGMEVQRATVSTLRNFVQTAQAAGTTPEGISPLDAVLGIRRGNAAADTPPASSSSASAAQAPGQQPASSQGAANPNAASAQAADATSESNSPGSDDMMAGATAAAQGWWNMLQQQFDNLAAATSASLQGAEALKAGMAGAAAQASGTDKPARKTAARKTATKSAPRKAARKTAAKTAGRAASPAGKAPARARKTPKA